METFMLVVAPYRVGVLSDQIRIRSDFVVAVFWLFDQFDLLRFVVFKFI